MLARNSPTALANRAPGSLARSEDRANANAIRRADTASPSASIACHSGSAAHQSPSARSGSGTCIGSVSVHHRFVVSSAAIAAMSAAWSAPVYSRWLKSVSAGPAGPASASSRAWPRKIE